jgi:hypothetical protein
MKTTTRLLATLTLLASPALAQTNTFPSSGNVGIGTSDPQPTVKLDVRQGGANAFAIAAYVYDGTSNSVAVRGHSYATSGSGTSYGVQGLSDFIRGTGTNIGGYFSAGGAANNYALITDAGLVGIGTTAPDQKLTIKGGGIGFDHNSADKKLYSPADGVLEWMTHDWATEKGFAVSHQGQKRVFLNVGIGTVNPTAKLEIADAGNASLRLGISNNASNAHAQIRQSLHTVAYNQASQAAVGAVPWNHYNDGNSPSFSGTFLLHNGAGMTGTTYGVPTANSGQLVMQNCDNAVIATNGMTPIYISPFGKVATTFAVSGNVGIGETNPQHKLAVNGTIKAKEIIVETTGWSDYVFASDYRLAPLSEVEAHIAEKKHLPGIPSAAEVAEKGVNVAQVQAALLAKVEELTLHLIAQEKTITELRGRLQQLEAR